MLSGSAKCIEEIADREGCSPRNMTLSLAFLAPEIVKAAIDGRLPRGVGISRLSDLGANSSDSLESPHPRRIDAYVPRTATESQRGEDRDGVERSGDRDFSAQISHTQPSGSMVRVLIAPPITHRTAEIFGERRQTPGIGAFRRVNLVSGFLARCFTDDMAVLSLPPKITFPGKRRPT
jgi:hypothetical protein